MYVTEVRKQIGDENDNGLLQKRKRNQATKTKTKHDVMALKKKAHFVLPCFFLLFDDAVTWGNPRGP